MLEMCGYIPESNADRRHNFPLYMLIDCEYQSQRTEVAISEVQKCGSLIHRILYMSGYLNATMTSMATSKIVQNVRQTITQASRLVTICCLTVAVFKE